MISVCTFACLCKSLSHASTYVCILNQFIEPNQESHKFNAVGKSLNIFHSGIHGYEIRRLKAVSSMSK